MQSSLNKNAKICSFVTVADSGRGGDWFLWSHLLCFYRSGLFKKARNRSTTEFSVNLRNVDIDDENDADEESENEDSTEQRISDDVPINEILDW